MGTINLTFASEVENLNRNMALVHSILWSVPNKFVSLFFESECWGALAISIRFERRINCPIVGFVFDKKILNNKFIPPPLAAGHLPHKWEEKYENSHYVHYCVSPIFHGGDVALAT